MLQREPCCGQNNGNTCVYTPIDREFRTWKRHRGGRARNVWTFDLVNNTSTSDR